MSEEIDSEVNGANFLHSTSLGFANFRCLRDLSRKEIEQVGARKLAQELSKVTAICKHAKFCKIMSHDKEETRIGKENYLVLSVIQSLSVTLIY